MTTYKEAVVYFKKLLPYTIMVKGTKFTHTLKHHIPTKCSHYTYVYTHTHTHNEHITVRCINFANIKIALMKEMEDTI